MTIEKICVFFSFFWLFILGGIVSLMLLRWCIEEGIRLLNVKAAIVDYLWNRKRYREWQRHRDLNWNYSNPNHGKSRKES